MYTLGVYYGHNGSAVLLKDGNIVGIVSEERFNGKKNYQGLPRQSIRYLLSLANINAKDLAAVTLSHTYAVPIHYSKLSGEKTSFLISFLILLNAFLSFLRNCWGYCAMQVPALRPLGVFFYDLGVKTIGQLSDEKERNYLASYLEIDRTKICSYDHHLSHASSAYYASSFNKKKALVFTADGEGDLLSSTVTVFNNDKYKVIATTRREQSLGYLYAHLTEFLGMKSNEHEYKVMGLAAYAKREDVEKIYKKIENIIWVNKKKLTFETTFNFTDAKRYFKREAQNIRFDILAAACQTLLENRLYELVDAAINKTQIHTVILSGGVFMNVKANQKIASLAGVRELFVLPSCGDESSILGSSYLAYRDYCKKTKTPFTVKPLEHVYFGPSFTGDEIQRELQKSNAYKKYDVSRVSDIEKTIAQLISEGAIVARLSGRMEFGARALGNRSILADPRNLSVVRVINEQIKNRDFWMPFAASILKERAGNYLRNPKNIESPYMMITFDTTERGKNELAAAIHQSDLTTRPQIVSREQNPSYYRIIREFEKITGVGAVLNTSFNLHGYPIVLGPKEALSAFAKSGLTHLVLENYLISKQENSKSL